MHSTVPIKTLHYRPASFKIGKLYAYGSLTSSWLEKHSGLLIGLVVGATTLETGETTLTFRRLLYDPDLKYEAQDGNYFTIHYELMEFLYSHPYIETDDMREWAYSMRPETPMFRSEIWMDRVSGYEHDNPFEAHPNFS